MKVTVMPVSMPNDTLDAAIWDTVRYFAVFDMPVTAVNVWRSLIVGNLPAEWQHSVPLRAIQQRLQSSPWLRQRLEEQWGFWCVKGQTAAVGRRLQRHLLSHYKWRVVRTCSWWLSWVPGVRMIAVSGSLAISHPKASSDLDLFVVTVARRIWLVRLLLLMVASVLGRRRRYFDEAAPDKLCLNHYITEDALVMNPAVRSVYTAVLYHHLVAQVGYDVAKVFWSANQEWLKKWVVGPTDYSLPSVHLLPMSALGQRVRRFLSDWLAEPIFDGVERSSERIQRWVVARHRQTASGGRIVLNRQELAFHPASKAAQIVGQWSR